MTVNAGCAGSSKLSATGSQLTPAPVSICCTKTESLSRFPVPKKGEMHQWRRGSKEIPWFKHERAWIFRWVPAVLFPFTKEHKKRSLKGLTIIIEGRFSESGRGRLLKPFVILVEVFGRKNSVEIWPLISLSGSNSDHHRPLLGGGKYCLIFLTIHFEIKVNFHFFTRAYAILWKSGIWLSIKDK